MAFIALGCYELSIQSIVDLSISWLLFLCSVPNIGRQKKSCAQSQSGKSTNINEGEIARIFVMTLSSARA